MYFPVQKRPSRQHYRAAMKPDADLGLHPNNPITLEKQVVSEAVLRKTLAQRAAASRKRPVLVQADHNLPYGRVITIVDAIREAGFSQVGFVTQAIPVPDVSR